MKKQVDFSTITKVSIPFQGIFFGRTVKQPQTRERQKWLKQHKTYQSSTYSEKLEKNKISLQQCQTTNYSEDKYIRYKAEGQIKYVSVWGVSSKIQDSLYEIEKDQKKKNTSFDDVSNDNNFCYQIDKPNNDHRYYNISKLFCKYCKEKGHHLRDCRKLNRTNVYMAAYVCYYCRQRGHIAKFCKIKRKDQLGEDSSTDGSPYKVAFFVETNYTVSPDIEY